MANCIYSTSRASDAAEDYLTGEGVPRSSRLPGMSSPDPPAVVGPVLEPVRAVLAPRMLSVAAATSDDPPFTTTGLDPPGLDPGCRASSETPCCAAAVAAAPTGSVAWPIFAA